MDQRPDHPNTTWPVTPGDSVEKLRQLLDELDKAGGAHRPLAWRGHASLEWQLQTTLDRRLQELAPNESYEEWLAREHAVIVRFKHLARPYASEIEARQLDGDIWVALALGRHAGLPTRLLDWTWSPWVAAWFACHEHSDADGVMWWFSQSDLETVIRPGWDRFGVPTVAQFYGLRETSVEQQRALGLNERLISVTAFSPSGKAWVTKIHYSYPCRRMEAQQGFATVCGRLRKAHNDAIDQLPNSALIRRGRIVIPAGIKGEVLALLRTMNLHAKSLEYPGVDIVARGIAP